MKTNIEKKYLKRLTESVASFIVALDDVMKEPSSYERGKMIAKLNNFLDMQNDAAMKFGLGYSWKKINNVKKRAGERRDDK